MTIFSLGHHNHATSDEVEGELGDFFDTERPMQLTDRAALAIAGYFAAPSNPALTLLATTGKGDTDALGAEVARELEAEDDMEVGMRDGLMMLEALDAWVSGKVG